MSRWRVFVEGFEVDPGNDFSAQFTYSIDDVKDFASRDTSFSKTIVLPGTTTNKKVFGHVFSLASGNFYDSTLANVGYNYNAAKSAKCIITQNNIQIFKGVIRIMEVIYNGNEVEIEAVVFGEMGGLLFAMGDKKLEDLDFSAYDHTFNITNIQNSWTAAAGSGYYYPLIDYGYSIDKISFPVETFRPAFYLKEYLDKIIAAAGYTYESTFFSTSYFKKLIIPFNAQYPTITVATVLHMTDVAYVSSTGTNSLMDFDTQVGTAYILVNAGKNRFTWDRAEEAHLKFNMSGHWSRSAGATSGGITIEVRVNGVAQITGGISWAAGVTSGTYLVEGSLTLNTNDYVEVWIVNFSGRTVTLDTTIMKMEGQPNIAIAIKYNDHLTANEAIPKNIFQRDVLKWIKNMFNLYIYEDKDREKHLKIEPYVDFYDTVSRVNWDEKIDRSQTVRVKPLGELNSRIYELKYKEDSDWLNDLYKKKWGEVYGTYIYDTGYEFMNDKQTIEVGFSPSPLVQYNNSDRVQVAILKKNETSEERTASNIRIIFRAASNITCQTWTIKNGATTLGTYTTYPYAGHLDDPDAPSDDLNFGSPKEFYFTIVVGYLSANLFNVFWSFYISEITDKDSKVLTGSFRLTPVDIYNLDFSKLIYCAGLLWRLNKVEDYSTDQPDLTRCELLKVTDIE